MSNNQISKSLENDTSFHNPPEHQDIGLSGGESAHLCRAIASIMARLSERQLRHAGENFFSYFDVRHEQLALNGNAIVRPSDAKAVPVYLRRIGHSLMQSARGARRTALDKRLNWVVGVLSLDKAEALILSAMARFCLFDSWRELTEVVPFKMNNPTCELLALITGLSLAETGRILEPGSRLLSSGMLVDENDGEYYVGRLLLRIARSHGTNPDNLTQRMMPQAPPSSLIIEDFAHLGPLRDLTERVIASGEPVSILLHGKPGTGKTEFARLLADRTQRRAVFVGLSDEQGGEPTRGERLAHLALLRSLGKETKDTVAIVDEADDVLRLSDFRNHAGSKQWLNRLVEEPHVPTIWILNDPQLLDPALLRRMTLAIAFDIPPLSVRARIAARAAEAHGIALTDSDLSELATLAAEPAIMTAGMQVARLADGGAAEARLGIESVLKAQGRHFAVEPLPDGCYDFSLAAADRNLEDLAKRLIHAPEQGWSMLLTGPSGTGKSAFARHLALHIGIELIECRGSDLLDAFVGGTEKQIADVFSRAAERGAMLLIDEADSFLFRREVGQRSWETGMVNEMLRWMEHLRAPFVATTNLAEFLDSAMQRRFTMRVNFHSMLPKQVLALFVARFDMHPPESLLSVSGLTPGDFAVVAHRARLLGEDRVEVLSEWLSEEAAVRGEKQGSVGFHLPEPRQLGMLHVKNDQT